MRASTIRVLAAAAGAVVGALVALLGSTSYRAHVTMLVAHGSTLPKSSEEALQGARTVSALAVSDAVASRVAASLALRDSEVAGRLSARPQGSSGLLRLSATQGSGERAVRVAQQAGLVVSQLVHTRFGSSGLRAAIWDPARGAEKLRPSAPLDAGLGAAAALALAALALFALRPRPAAGLRDESSQSRRVSPPAPEPAREPEPTPSRALVSDESSQSREPLAAAPPAPLEPEPGRFSLAALEQAAVAAPLPPGRREEIDAYLDALREQADEHGLLPDYLAPMVREVFGDLI